MVVHNDISVINKIKYHIFYLYPFSSWFNKYLKHLADKYSIRNNLYEKTLCEINEYTKEPVEAIRLKHEAGPAQHNDNFVFDDQGNLTKDSVEEFYKSYSYYIYELPLWNAERARPFYLWKVIRQYLSAHSYRSLLDYGGGAADLCMELSKHNLKVDYFDISRPLHEFVKWRLAKRGIDTVRMYDNLEKINNEPYDCVVSFDVFEHLKNLEEQLGLITKLIKPGGSLIFSGAFSGGSLHLEENEKYDNFKALNSLLSSNGLSFVKKFAQFYFYKKGK